jgi:prephenate dehydrogenase
MTKTLAIIGVGSFGTFLVRHLTPFFDVVVHDPGTDLKGVLATFNVRPVSFAEAATADIVIPAVPVQNLEAVLQALAPALKAGALVIDVASVKVRPLALLEHHVPERAEYIALHPLFGPQSGRDGIGGLNIAVCEGRTARRAALLAFLREQLRLNVVETTAEAHDHQMATVQGLTHLIGRVLADFEMPPAGLTTRGFEHLMAMIETVRHDSDALFTTIERENPYAAQVKEAFFEAARTMERRLNAS